MTSSTKFPLTRIASCFTKPPFLLTLTSLSGTCWISSNNLCETHDIINCTKTSAISFQCSHTAVCCPKEKQCVSHITLQAFFLRFRYPPHHGRIVFPETAADPVPVWWFGRKEDQTCPVPTIHSGRLQFFLRQNSPQTTTMMFNDSENTSGKKLVGGIEIALVAACDWYKQQHVQFHWKYLTRRN